MLNKIKMKKKTSVLNPVMIAGVQPTRISLKCFLFILFLFFGVYRINDLCFISKFEICWQAVRKIKHEINDD